MNVRWSTCQQLMNSEKYQIAAVFMYIRALVGIESVDNWRERYSTKLEAFCHT